MRKPDLKKEPRKALRMKRKKIIRKTKRTVRKRIKVPRTMQ